MRRVLTEMFLFLFHAKLFRAPFFMQSRMSLQSAQLLLIHSVALDMHSDHPHSSCHETPVTSSQAEPTPTNRTIRASQQERDQTSRADKLGFPPHNHPTISPQYLVSPSLPVRDSFPLQPQIRLGSSP